MILFLRIRWNLLKMSINSDNSGTFKTFSHLTLYFLFQQTGRHILVCFHSDAPLGPSFCGYPHKAFSQLQAHAEVHFHPAVFPFVSMAHHLMTSPSGSAWVHLEKKTTLRSRKVDFAWSRLFNQKGNTVFCVSCWTRNTLSKKKTNTYEKSRFFFSFWNGLNITVTHIIIIALQKLNPPSDSGADPSAKFHRYVLASQC